MGAAGGVALPSDDEFNRVSFLSHFDGSNNGVNNAFDDSSSSNHTITSNGDATQGSFGPFARSDGYWGVAFDGSDDRLSAPDSADFDFGTGDFTIELFFNYRGSIANRWLIGGANHWQLRLKTASSPSRLGEVSFITNGSTEIIYVSPSDLADSAWHHIAITREGTNLRHFLDGALVKTTTNSETINADSALYIGASSTNSEDWDGHISNVRVVKGTAVYTSAFTTPAAPLTAVTNTKLLTCQNNRFVDNSASAHTITPSGDAAVSAFGPFLTSEVYDPAVNGASAYFPATDNNDFLESSASSDYQFGTGDLTVELWSYNLYSADSRNYADNRGHATGWKVGRTASNLFQVFSEGSGGVLFEGGSAPNNTWVHFCWTRASGVNKFFINGVQSGSNVSNSDDFNSNSLKIGTRFDSPGGADQEVKGYISDLRIIKGTAVEPSGIPTAPLKSTAVTNTKLLLNMADGQAIDSAAQHNLTLFGNAKISNTQSKFGGTSMVFDGTGDFALAQGFNDLSGPFTIECFARADDTTNAFVWCVGVYTIELGINGNDLRIWRSSGYTNFFTGGEFTANNWHHVALVRDTSNVIKLYLNGTASSTTVTDSTTYAAGDGLIIGGEYASATSINHGWDGYIDEFRVSQFARYTSNFTPPTEPFADKGQ